ncbi:MAG: DNA polymerase domain-containing protein [Nanoarchaeota archaeon]
MENKQSKYENGTAVSLLDIPSKEGISLSDLKENCVKINTQHHIKHEYLDVNNSYVLDIETYNLNSMVRLIQLYDVKNNNVILWLHGSIKDKNKLLEDPNIKNNNISIEFKLFQSEKEMIISFYSFLYEFPKPILGHNVSHFDLGMLNSKKIKYKFTKTHFFAYSIGSGITAKRVNFSYVIKETGDEQNWYNDYKKKRYVVVDTMLIAFNLNEQSSLKDLSRKCNSKFPKIDLGPEGYKLFENEELDYETILYGIYDVLSIPDVYYYLKKIIEKPSEEYLKIEMAQSQRCVEHVWMKGSGSLAESFLSKLLGVGINLDTPDYLTKYFGGITRCWNKSLVKSDKNSEIRYLDFTSYYPFSIRKQGIFDILNGDFESIVNQKFNLFKDKYDSMIYSSTFKVKAKIGLNVIIEGEKHKKQKQIGVGILRSFNKDERVQDLQHQLMIGKLHRGKTTILTKTELELTKSLVPESFKNLIIEKIIDALIPTKYEKSEQYISLYKTRKELKENNNPAEKGIKVLLNSCYGKLAESKGKWFNLACAAAITGYCRASLMDTISFAKQNGVEVLYSDTDSMYVKANRLRIQKVQKYADGLNEHPLRFGEKNLKDEGEDIVSFWGIKRKSYCKLVNIEGVNMFIPKGENGNSDIKWRDDLFRLFILSNGSTNISNINQIMSSNDLKFCKKIDTQSFENFSKEFYEDNEGQSLSDIFKIKSRAKVTRYYNIHVKKSKNYDCGVYYGKLIKAWENKTQETAYCGLFFSINRDYTFETKSSEELKWGLEYQSYISNEDEIPIIDAHNYENLLLQEIRLDTIKIKTRSTISLNLLSEDNRKNVTSNLMLMGHSGQTKRLNDLGSPPLMFRLSIPQNLDVDKTLTLNKKGPKDKYANATLFITYIKQVEAVCRINKARMFVEDRNIFTIYRFISRLGSYLQKLILKKLKEYKQGVKRSIIGVELDYFPRFTFISQCDIHQGTTEEHLRNMHAAAFDSGFHTTTINKFIAYQFSTYLHLIGYHKKASAEYKLKIKNMESWEEDVFIKEMEEEYRSETKFKLKRNLHETLSYIFALNAIKQEDFFELIKTPKSKFSKKICDFKFGSWINGELEFNEKKCIILFQINTIQVMETNLDENLINQTTPLEGSWVLNGQVTPQPAERLAKYFVKWRFETDKIANLDKLEEAHIEVIRDF